MSDALVYTWPKHIDIFANCDKSPNNLLVDLLPPDPAHPNAAAPTDLYAARRMSDDVLSAESSTATTATTTSRPHSPATEPSPPALRKPSLPGIGALTPLLDPNDPFPRRASLPTLASDLSIARSPAPRAAPFRSPQAQHRPFDPALASYTFPPGAPPAESPVVPDRPRLDPSFAYPPQPGQPSATSSTFPSPFGSPLSPAPFGQYQQQQQQQQQTTQPQQQQQQQQWSPDGTSSTSSPESPRAKRRPSPTTVQAAPPAPDAPPQRRRGKLPKHTTDLLKEWLHAHSDHPYPSEDEKRDLCARTKLSMSQVSNWMINARRRILAPAKHPTQAATTTEPYRPLGVRPIGALYPSHAHAQAYPRYREDALRLYDPSGFGSFPSPVAYPQYPAQERRLAYPGSPLDYSHPHAHPQAQAHAHPHAAQGYPSLSYRDGASAAAAPRFYAAAPEL